jgi:hypothetical protein
MSSFLIQKVSGFDTVVKGEWVNTYSLRKAFTGFITAALMA